MLCHFNVCCLLTYQTQEKKLQNLERDELCETQPVKSNLNINMFCHNI